MNKITKAEMSERLSNITQLQELLFGEQIKKYDSRLEQHHQRLHQLESDTKKFQLVIEERIQQLEKSLLDKINSVASSLEKKIKYLDINTHEEQVKIQQEIDVLSQNSYDNIDFLQNSLNSHANSLKTEINQSKASLDRDLQLVKKQMLEKLESSIAELSVRKASRSDLAELLFELCLKIKGTDLNLPPEKEHSNETSVELILPENNGSSEPIA